MRTGLPPKPAAEAGLEITRRIRRGLGGRAASRLRYARVFLALRIRNRLAPRGTSLLVFVDERLLLAQKPGYDGGDGGGVEAALAEHFANRSTAFGARKRVLDPFWLRISSNDTALALRLVRKLYFLLW